MFDNIIKNRIASDDGFMGPTHSMSAIAFYLLCWLFIPNFMMYLGLTNSITFILLSSFIVAGVALWPDLDSPKSTALSVLGPIGFVISKFMRFTSVAIFNVTKSKYDADEADPHRGFWHTILSGFLFGILVFYSFKIDYPINSPLAEYNLFTNVKDIIGFLWIFISIQLAISGLFNSFVKSKKSSVTGLLVLFTIGTIISLTIIKLNTSYDWIPPIFSMGYIFHLLGDSCTRSGVPLLFPFKIKGKRWYNIRFAKIAAGSAFEMTFVLPLFTIISVLCFILILFGGV